MLVCLFFGSNYNIGELTLKHRFKRKNDHKNYFHRYHTHELTKGTYASKLHIRQTQHCIEHEKFLFLPLWKYRRFTHDSKRPYDQWVTVTYTVNMRMGHYTLFSVVSSILQNVFSRRIVCEPLLQSVRLLRKSFMKPWRGIQQFITYAVVEKEMENKGKLWCKHWSCCGCRNGTFWR